MVEITHTSDEGTVAWGVPKDDEPAAVLQAADWCWSRHLAAWHLPASRYQAVSILHVDEAAAALQAAGFDVSLRIDDEQTQRRYSLKWAGHQILYLEGKLSKVDRLLEQHFQTVAVGSQTSAATDLWAIRMLLRRIDLEERLRHWREISDGIVEGTPPHTLGTIRKGDYVRISGHLRKVARVNQKSVTVETENSGTGRAPYREITGHRIEDGPDGPLP